MSRQLAPAARCCGWILRVQGRVEGSIRLSETLYVDPGGEVAADVVGEFDVTEFPPGE